MRTDSNAKWLEYVSNIGRYELPLDYLPQFNKNIRAVTQQSMLDAWRRRINADMMTTVIVGSDEP